ncbi:MAG: type II secretion system protein [Chloroflexi bacterium]|nr:type II secretion system protein [Chloroflexota bacterium]
MRGVALRFLTRKRGFTLVEILIAVAILGIVAAVAVPTVATIKSRSEAKANAGELMNVASALHTMMSDQELDSVTAIPQASATNAMSAFPDGTYPLYSGATGDYLRQATTKCTYYVTAAGRVSQDSC